MRPAFICTFVIVAPGDIYTTDRPYMLLFVKKESDIHTGKDLTNKTIAAPALRDLTSMATLAWIDQNGGDSKTVRTLEFPADFPKLTGPSNLGWP